MADKDLVVLDKPFDSETAMTLASYGTRIDMREIPAPDRHALAFNTFRLLDATQTMDLVYDHDPEPLFHQFQERTPGGFSWDYLERGPGTWRVRIMRIPRAANTGCACACCS